MIILLTAFLLDHFGASAGWWVLFVISLFIEPKK